MTIKELTTRECCDARRDLVEIIGHPVGRPYFFCKHCGRHHVDRGGSEPEAEGIVPLPWPWEEV